MKIDLEQLKEPCTCGKAHPLNVRDIVFKQGAIDEIPVYLQTLNYSNPSIICDTNTYEAAGKIIAALISGCNMIMLDAKDLHADEHGVAFAQKGLSEQTDLLIAVGAGTIHDITRYVAYDRQIPFFSVPTAASVDGFVSTVAAMTWNGFKKSFTAVSPEVVFADSNIYAKAPSRLTASGASDLLGKYTALADWKLGNLLLNEYICPKICKMEEEALSVVASDPAGLKKGDRQACENLMYGLLLSGLAMQMVGNSRPASGAEHHLSHLWEMALINEHTSAYHGEKVGVGLVIACRRYREAARYIQAKSYQIAPTIDPAEEIAEFAGESNDVFNELLSENTPNPLGPVTDQLLEEKSEEIAALLNSVPDADKVRQLLIDAGAPVTMEEIGLSSFIEKKSIQYSPYIRSRLTGMKLIKKYIYPN